MASVTQKLITADEFARLANPSDGSRQELVRGEVVTMPPPKGKHGACCSRIDRRVGAFVEEKKLGEVFANDTGFVTAQDPDSVRGPDIAFWSRERLPAIPDEYIRIAPDLAVEVLSPSNRAEVFEKLPEYFECGVRLVWIADPENRTVTVYRSAEEGRILHETATISGEDVLPGFSCRVGEFFV